MNTENKPLVLKSQELFACPDNWSQIEAWVEKHPPGDRVHLYTAIFMTINLIVKKEKQKQLIIEI